ncbi:ASCH domain-containing protein [Brenneria populi]|uniref:ASCH domain-containing protein n=1 Tax=Brenneria populi TaxID=1505588 RepID=A0ABU6JQK1_9GAMM|nr:ASCH domain-containing protein [Brenneria populi Li et al. 2015]
MKALSIVYPAGSKIACGQKTLEIRRWRPDLAENEELLIVENHKFLMNDGDEDLGLAVAIITIGDIRAFTVDDIDAACASSYEPGWLAWEIKSVKKIAEPFPVRAARKIYQV